MLKAHTTAILCVAALALSACGGGDNSADNNGKTTAKTPTPSATATPSPTPDPKADPETACKEVDVKGIDACKVGRARDQFVEICTKRRTKPKTRDDKTDMTDLRKATTTLVRAFRANPDEKWRRAEGRPNVSMRARLVSLGLVARLQCGGGDAFKLGQRMGRALAKDPKKD